MKSNFDRVADDKTPTTIREPRDSASTGGYNSGRVTSKAAAGQTVIEDYALDRSSVVTPAAMERGRPLAGSCTDLSHSLKGVATSDHGANARGRSDTTKTPTKISYGRD